MSVEQNFEVLRVLAVIIPNHCQYSLSVPVPPTETNLLQLPLAGSYVCECFLQNNGHGFIGTVRRWSKYTAYHTPSILGIFRVFWYCEYTQHSQYPQTKYCQHLQYPQYRTPKYLNYTGIIDRNKPRYCESGSICITKPRHTASTRRIRSTLSRNTASARSTCRILSLYRGSFNGSIGFLDEASCAGRRSSPGMSPRAEWTLG